MAPLSYIGRQPEALAAYERAIEIDPKDAASWSNKGNAPNDLGRHAEALTAYERAIAIDPTFAVAWNNKGYALNDLGRHAEALTACDRAIEINPENAYAWEGRGAGPDLAWGNSRRRRRIPERRSGWRSGTPELMSA